MPVGWGSQAARPGAQDALLGQLMGLMFAHLLLSWAQRSGGQAYQGLATLLALLGGRPGPSPSGGRSFRDAFGRRSGHAGRAPTYGASRPDGTFPARDLQLPRGPRGDALLSPASVAMIEKAEGFDQPGRHPGGASGVTIGVGYDLGYKTKAEFRRDWGGRLSPQVMNRLESAVGLKGAAAKRATARFRDITIDRDTARQVFRERTLPKFYARTQKAFPGFERLPPDAKGALVSLVFNRGESMRGDRRREMREVRSAIARGDLRSAAQSIRSMKRLWYGKGLNGLLTRRENEARMLERVA